MMGADNGTATTTSGISCGACGHQSASEAKFCAGCGQTLHEPCSRCNKPVLLTQKFCGSCGSNLEEALQKRMHEIEGYLANAVAAAKRKEFDEAILLLRRAGSSGDYRLAELTTQAKAAVEKVIHLRDQSTSSAAALTAQAQQAFDDDKKSEAARLIGQIPEPLRSDEAKHLLKQSLDFLGQASSLVTDLQNSIKDKNWVLAGALLSQALELSPDDPQYQKLGKQVAEKLYKEYDQNHQRCQYTRAAQCLGSVPEACQRADHLEKQTEIDDVVWLADQFDAEPFATANLGRLAVRMTKEVPHDDTAKATVKKLAAQVKQKPDDVRNPWATWIAGRQSWFGGAAGMLAYPKSVEFAADSELRKYPGRFNVAIGLAMQGLGLGRVTENFIEAKGFFGFGKRKNTSAWGIDIGASAIRAVLLELDEQDDPVVQESYCQVYEKPTCRAGQDSKAHQTISQAIEQMLEQLEIDDVPVWINLPANELVTRFVRLPPLNDKRARAMLKSEAEQKIPLSLEDLQLVQWISEVGENEAHGRPAAVSAARKTSIQRRVELCEEAGLKITGMQADPLALVNFADEEFGQWWAESNSEADDQEPTTDAKESSESVVLIDSGAATTTLVIVSAEAYWFWTIESGGEALTAAMANSTKLAAADAEDKKLHPASLTHPRQQYEPMERRQAELRGRLEKLMVEAKRQNERFDIVESWCCGGACLAHGWIRRIMLV